MKLPAVVAEGAEGGDEFAADDVDEEADGRLQVGHGDAVWSCPRRLGMPACRCRGTTCRSTSGKPRLGPACDGHGFHLVGIPCRSMKMAKHLSRQPKYFTPKLYGAASTPHSGEPYMAGQYIDMKAADGSGVPWYLVPASARARAGPAQEIFGVNKTMRDVADFTTPRRATRCWLPDIFWRRSRTSSWATPRPTGNAPSASRASTAKGMEDIRPRSPRRARPEVSNKKVGVLGSASAASWPTCGHAHRCRRVGGLLRVGIDAARRGRQRSRPLVLYIAELDVLPARGARQDRKDLERPAEHHALPVPGQDHALRARRRRSFPQALRR